ncbi:PIG-L deacetylase family protein [Sphingomonas sp. FW199]|uniref:PIG-L deacetylase family protein n=1 Tax=Sphingomonas sp. FW199 TaxID=3400217 RepID=UPI003CED1AFD
MRAARLLTPPAGRCRRLLVLAPHPDDETLGAGALIRQAVTERWYGGTVYLTDGGASHPAADPAARARLVRARQREARVALRRLGDPAARLPATLNWPDAAPLAPDSKGYRCAVRRLSAYCRRLGIGMIAVTSPRDPHCDHVAAAALAHAVGTATRSAIRIVEYGVWSDGGGVAGRLWRTRPLAPGIRRSALAAHRSQRSAAYGPGFRVPLQAGWSPSRDILYERGR